MRLGNYRYMQLRFGCRLALQCETPDVPWEFDHIMWNSGIPGLDWNGAIMHRRLYPDFQSDNENYLVRLSA